MKRSYVISVSNAVYLAGFNLVWFAGIFLGITLQIPGRSHPAGFAAATAAFFVGIAPGLMTALVPYRVTLTEPDELELRSILRRRVLRIREIRALEWDEDYIRLVHDQGKARVWADESFKEPLARVLELNPAIKLDDESRELIVAG